MKIRNTIGSAIICMCLLVCKGVILAQNSAVILSSESSKPLQMPTEGGFANGVNVDLVVSGLVDKAGMVRIPFVYVQDKSIQDQGDLQENMWRRFENLRTSERIHSLEVNRQSGELLLEVSGLSSVKLLEMVQKAVAVKTAGTDLPSVGTGAGFKSVEDTPFIKPMNADGSTKEYRAEDANQGWTSLSVPSRDAIIPGTVVHRIEVLGLDERMSKSIQELLKNPAFVWFEFDLEKQICIATMNYPETWTKEKTEQMIVNQVTNVKIGE